jgi:hypothetical protein
MPVAYTVELPKSMDTTTLDDRGGGEGGRKNEGFLSGLV